MPVDPPTDSWACRRAWDRMRAAQDEYRQRHGVDVRREIAREFSAAATDYRRAAARHAEPDPFAAVAGLAEVSAVHRLARELADIEAGQPPRDVRTAEVIRADLDALVPDR